MEIISILLVILAIDAGIAYWILDRFITIPGTNKYRIFWKVLIFLTLFILLSFLTLYLISITFRFER